MENIQAVYITSNGEKYHNKNCQSIQEYKIKPISLEEAQKRNKLPCKVCIFDNNYNNYKDIKKKNNKNFKKPKNFINSDDADDTIFNDSAFFRENKNKEISNNNIINNNEKEENKKFNKFEIEERDSNDSDSDDSNHSNKFSINNITESSILNSNPLKKESFIEPEDTTIENIITDKENKEINDILKDNKNNIIKSKRILSNIENMNKNNFIEDKEIFNEEEKIKNNKIYNNFHDIEDNKYNGDNGDEIKYNKNLDKNYSNNFNMKINPINSINKNIKDNNIKGFKYNKYFSSYNSNNMCNNNYKTNFICEKYDMNILEETYNRAILLPFSNIINDSKYINYNPKVVNGQMVNDSYMFIFEISSLMPKSNIFLKIKVGFKLEYINSKDINLLLDEHSINEENMNYQMGSLGAILKMQRHLEIFKSTGTVYALINISKGKFFIIGKNELEKRKQNIFLDRNNTDIFYAQNFLSISPTCLKNIKPSFHTDKKYLKFFEIKLNNKKLK